MKAEKFFFKHYSYVLKIIRFKAIRYGLDSDECINFVINKISQDNFNKIRAFKGTSKFTTYLTVVINRLIISYARKNKKIPAMPPIITKTPLDILIEQQQNEYTELIKANLPKLLHKLSSQERQVLKMKYFRELNINRIAEELQISRYKVNIILDSSLEYLRNKIKDIHCQ